MPPVTRRFRDLMHLGNPSVTDLFRSIVNMESYYLGCAAFTDYRHENGVGGALAWHFDKSLGVETFCISVTPTSVDEDDGDDDRDDARGEKEKEDVCADPARDEKEKEDVCTRPARDEKEKEGVSTHPVIGEKEKEDVSTFPAGHKTIGLGGNPPSRGQCSRNAGTFRTMPIPVRSIWGCNAKAIYHAVGNDSKRSMTIVLRTQIPRNMGFARSTKNNGKGLSRIHSMVIVGVGMFVALHLFIHLFFAPTPTGQGETNLGRSNEDKNFHSSPVNTKNQEDYGIVHFGGSKRTVYWEEYVDKTTGGVYFHNSETGETTWRRPGGDVAFIKISGTEGSVEWEKIHDERTQQTYYYNTRTNDVAWHLPGKSNSPEYSNAGRLRNPTSESTLPESRQNIVDGACNIVGNVDMLGGDVPNYDGVFENTYSMDSCCKICREMPSCWGFTLVRNEMTCYLKTGQSKLVRKYDDNIISGAVTGRVPSLVDESGRVEKIETVIKSTGTLLADAPIRDAPVPSMSSSNNVAQTPSSSPLLSPSPEVWKVEAGHQSPQQTFLPCMLSDDSSVSKIWHFVETSTVRAPEPDIVMESVYDNLPVGDPDGGPWKQGWRVTYDKSAARRETLYVHVVPHSHNDPGWIKTYSKYYHTETKQILDSVVKTLSLKRTRKFIWAEISYLSLWWSDSSESLRNKAKELIRNGQLEIVTGGWVMNDEANPDIPAIIGQMVEGHRWLEKNLNLRPRYGWAIDPFGHTATMAYVLKRMGFEGMLIQRVYYAVKKKFARDRTLEFKWRQIWDTDGSTDMFCHMMPFYSYDVPHTCGPDPSVCCQFDFKRKSCPWKKSPIRITRANVKDRAELLLDQWRKKASLYQSSHVLVPLGDDFRYTTEKECNDQFTNFEEIFDFLARERSTYNVVASFSTLGEYFDGVKSDAASKKIDFPVVQGDFFTYADKTDEFWSGYYVSRSFYKAKCRILFARLRAAEILFTMFRALSRGGRAIEAAAIAPSTMYEQLSATRKNLALFMHHDGITGTAKSHVVVDYGQRMHDGLKDSMGIMTSTLSAIGKSGGLASESVLTKFDGLDERRVLFRDDSSGRTTTETVVLYNPFASRVIVSSVKMDARALEDEVCVFGYRDDETWGPLRSQLSPVFAVRSRSFFEKDVVEIFFEAFLPAYGATSFQISRDPSSCDSIHRAVVSDVSVGSTVRDIQSSDLAWGKSYEAQLLQKSERISIKSDFVEAVFDARTGLLRTMRSGGGRSVEMSESFAVYKTRRSGAYLFVPNGKPVACCAASTVWTVHGSLVQQTAFVNSDATVFREARLSVLGTSAEALEMRHVLDWGQTHNNEEIVVRYDSKSITSRDMVFVTDENGFNPAVRKHRTKLPLQANFFPMPTYVQRVDDATGDRLSVHCTRALGVAAPKPGEFQIMLERRPSHDDNRGLGQGINDNVPTEISLRLLVEPRSSLGESESQKAHLMFPSLRSKTLSLSSNYPPYAFFVADRSDASSALGKWRWAPVVGTLPPFVNVMNWMSLDSSGETAALTLQTHGVREIARREHGALFGVDVDLSRWLRTSDGISIQNIEERSLSFGPSPSRAGGRADSNGDFGYLRLWPMEVQAFLVTTQ
eukprot:g2969.t1